MTSNRTAERLTLVLAILTGVFAILAIAIHLRSGTNDDTYVYFNYARNFVAGRPFAYDPRNIPSEGFTSAVYLLLLIPFEAARINMMFSAQVLNLLSIALIVYLCHRVLREDKVLEGPFNWLAVGLFSLFLARDGHIPIIVSRGLETMLGPATVLWAVVYVARIHQSHAREERVRALNMFLVVAFISFLTRPENIVMLGAAGGLILVAMRRSSQLPELMVRLAAFVAALLAYFGGKLLFFGDVLQTGYYRKVDAGGTGVEYVLGAMQWYRHWLAAAVALGVVSVGLWCWRHREERWRAILSLSPRPSILALIILCVAPLFIFLPSEPLIGYAFRYLINYFVFLYLLVAVGLAYLLSVVLAGIRYRATSWVPVAVAALVAFSTGSVAMGERGLERTSARLKLYQRAETSTARHRYVRIGAFLRERIPNIEDLTLVFGDAGVLPYALGSRFIDANGLTEPYIARLFAEPNGPEKAKKFSDYVLSWHPDIIILAFGRADEHGRWASVSNTHSPFRGPTPISVFRDYRAHGLGYVCTAHAYYDLHFGVREDSKHFETASSALLDYCEKNGLVLEDGLTITLEGEEVHFPRLARQQHAP